MPGSTRPSIASGSPTFRWAASSPPAFLPFVLLALARLAEAQVPLAVSGALVGSDEAVQVRVDLENTSDGPLAGVRVSGDLVGSHAEAQAGVIGAGRTASAVLIFPYATEWRLGRHVLPLSIDYAAGTGRVNVLAYLILPLGATAEPALRMAAPATSLGVRSRMSVRVESADGRPHRARLRMLTPRGLIAPDPPPVVDVPAHGSVMTEVALLNGVAVPDSRQGVLILAQALEGSTERMAVATSEVDIAPDSSWLAHLRAPLLLVALILVGAGALAEGRRPRS